MNSEVEQRFLELFVQFPTEREEIRRRIEEAISMRLLRGDAAHFLLVNIDQVIARPLSRMIDDEEINGLAMQTLDLVLSELRSRDRGEWPFSAHAALVAVDRVWDEINKPEIWGS